jgi:hypothetical protein
MFSFHESCSGILELRMMLIQFMALARETVAGIRLHLIVVFGKEFQLLYQLS